MPASPWKNSVEVQALSLDLREAVMACLSGGESRCWTIAELVERFKNLGVCATRASVTAALAELALELELSSSRALAPDGRYQCGRRSRRPRFPGGHQHCDVSPQWLGRPEEQKAPE